MECGTHFGVFKRAFCASVSLIWSETEESGRGLRGYSEKMGVSKDTVKASGRV